MRVYLSVHVMRMDLPVFDMRLCSVMDLSVHVMRIYVMMDHDVRVMRMCTLMICLPPS